LNGLDALLTEPTDVKHPGRLLEVGERQERLHPGGIPSLTRRA
jgi:hypothetical protein